MADDAVHKGKDHTLWQATEERNPHNRAKLVATALQAYAGEDGRFNMPPRKILERVIPNLNFSDARSYASGRASRLVQELLKAGWLENKQTVNGAAGIWYLNVERLGPTDDATRMTQAVRAVNDIRALYPDPKLRQLIAQLLERDEP